MKFDKKLRDDAVDYSVGVIKHICSEIPPREPGSEAERAAQEYMAKDIRDNGWADEIRFQEFPVSSKAFMAFSRIIPILIAAGIILYWWLPWAPLVFNVVALSILVFQFLLYWRFLDPLFKKTTSANVIATKKPTGEVKRRIIFSGHSDAAFEWRVFRKFGAAVHIGSLVFAFIGAMVSIGISIASLIISESALTDNKIWLLVIMLAFLPGYLSLFLYSNYKRVVPGANDNLTGCLGSVSILKCMKEAGIELENTEVVCLLTGSEEAGLRGAKVFAEEYKDKFKENGVETVLIGLETFRDIEHMSIYVRDMTGLVKSDARVVRLLDKAVESLGKKPLPHASVYVGASDAAAATQAGIPSCTLASMDPAPARYYHTRNDSADNLEPECMALGLEISLETLEVFDRDGLQ